MIFPNNNLTGFSTPSANEGMLQHPIESANVVTLAMSQTVPIASDTIFAGNNVGVSESICLNSTETFAGEVVNDDEFLSET